jgi:hypothetical protein
MKKILLGLAVSIFTVSSVYAFSIDKTPQGVFASNSKVIIGLVDKDSQQPYIVVWNTRSPKNNQAPALAVQLDGNGKAIVQLPGCDGTFNGVRRIPLNEFVEKLKDLD